MHTKARQSKGIVRTPKHVITTTLVDLVTAVSQTSEDERLVVATVAHLVNNGQARLIGTFKGARAIIV